MSLLILFVGNLGRRLSEWAEGQYADRADVPLRSIVEEVAALMGKRA